MADPEVVGDTEQHASVHTDPAALLGELHDLGVRRGDALALTIRPGTGLGLGLIGPTCRALITSRPQAAVALIEQELRPRWIWWDNTTPSVLLGQSGGSVRTATCWDLSAVHRLIYGGWRTDPGRIWAALHGLSDESIPGTGQLDLLGHTGDEGGDLEDPIQTDGHLRPEWASGGWTRGPDRWSGWAAIAVRAYLLQRERLTAPGRRGGGTGRALATARSESAAELLCAEMGFDGLPVDLDRAQQLLASFIGPRPRDAEDAQLNRARRDDAVKQHVPGIEVDLRSPSQVKAMLLRVGIDVPNTRSWRLEVFRGAHPVVDALLTWRRAERFATTYGYDWLDKQVGADGRMRGTWTGCDGGAGRMTASAGLHSMPAELRPAVAATEGHVLVRADLGQIEPRVLAGVSGDHALATATQDDDLYAPVASRLGVDRPVAKVAVLAAMYGQTSGAAGEALKGLESAYPVAMRYLRTAYEAGRTGRDVHTYGGRLVRMWPTPAGLDEQQERANVAGRGRYARNAVIQGAAAEFFKAWAVTVRSRGSALAAQIVLCLHDELLVHAPEENGDAVARLLKDCLAESAAGWLTAPISGKAPPVRFVADVSVIHRWSEAKD
ncbi:MAG: polymerase [Pseudonocardiales bacterium]|nr:polymerase [Pseudonocardiales bacterium]